MLNILIILGCIALGMGLGWIRRNATAFLRTADTCSMLAVYGLLFILGAGIGGDPTLMGALPVLGARAFCISLCCTAGSVLCLVPLNRHFQREPQADRHAAPGPNDSTPPNTKETRTEKSGASPLTGSLKIVCAFLCGVLPAMAGLTPAWLSDSALASYALFFLVFTVGIGLGANLKVFRIPRALHAKILSVPFLIILGSILGSLVACALLPGVSPRDALSVGLGLGYYSLASILIENAGHSALASVALLSNILREVVSILAAPLLVRYFGGITCVGASGATAMDSTLPVIARFAGERIAVVAVFSGMTLTLLVPFLVTAVLQW